MPSSDPFKPSPLQRTTSRTRTAKVPIEAEAIFIYGTSEFEDLYAGPVDVNRFPPGITALSGALATYPITQGALQVFGCNPNEGRQEVIDRKPDPIIYVFVDLGKLCQISRIELYGNLLQPPVDAATGPLYNFGLPRRVSVAVAEEPRLRWDLHRIPHIEAWLADNSSPFHVRYEAQDVRALWGWTTIHLPPTYGRFLMFGFADLPLIMRPERRFGGRGIDLQRLVIYPYLEDVDHHPVVEGVLVSVRQTNYAQPQLSPYWEMIFEGPPQPETHQSVTILYDRLPWPSVLSYLPITTDGRTEWTYESEIVKLDSDDRLVLTFAATTDEIPVLDALRFAHRVRHAKAKDPVVPWMADDAEVLYAIDVYVTNDEEAAWSPDLTHSSWRLVRAGANYAAQLAFFSVDFAEPVRSRYVRAVIALRKRPGAAAEATHGRLRLTAVALGRCRDFVLSPEPDEDLQVDAVLLRLYGKSLTDDYAFINGVDGLALTVETRTAGGPFQEIRRIRNLLDLVENTAVRQLSNPRVPDKPIQLYREHVDGTNSGNTRTDTSASQTNTDTTLPVNARNITVSRTGSTTTHVENAKTQLVDVLRDASIGSFPSRNTLGVETKRHYQFNVGDLPDPAMIQDPISLAQFMSDLLTFADVSPIPINFGVGVSGSLGASAVGQVSGGASVSVGGSIGGGKTLSTVRGDQASIGESQTTTLFAESHQQASSTGFSQQSRSGDSIEDRMVRREDLSAEVRKTGLSVRYGGVYEDVILVTVPVRRLLTGRSYVQSAADQPPLTGDMMRVRVDHLPDGVRLDVEFRGTILPIRED